MKQLSCTDLGSGDCEYAVIGDTTTEIKHDMTKHLEEFHGDMWASMGPHEKLEMSKKMELMVKEI